MGTFSCPRACSHNYRVGTHDEPATLILIELCLVGVGFRRYKAEEA
jgi:hypothetical protein